MTRTAVPTIVGIIEEAGGTVEDYPETVVEALDELAEVIESGGGSGASIDLGITGASVGEVAAVAAVDGSGKPTAWGSDSLDASDVGAIAAPSSPATGAFLVYNGSAWVAQTLSAWQGGSY